LVPQHTEADLSAHAYNAHLWGTVFGADRYIADRLLAVSALAMSEPMVKNDPGIGDLEYRQHQVSTYAYLDHAPFYVDAVLSFAHDTHETARRIAFGMTDRRRKAGSAGSSIPAIWKQAWVWRQERSVLLLCCRCSMPSLSLHGYEETGRVRSIFRFTGSSIQRFSRYRG
jgi:uncharacterized protein with beta-barrel porin domain